MINGFIQQAAFTQPDQRRDRQLLVVGVAFEIIIEATQLLTKLPRFIFYLRLFGRSR